jgi:hypothetical protein
LASPPAIGSTAAAAGAFTTLSASSTVSGAGFDTYLASPPAIGATAAAAGSFSIGNFAFGLNKNGTAATTTSPVALAVGGGTMTDTSSPASTTTTLGAVSSFAVTTLASTNVSNVYDAAASLYLGGGPVGGTNVTINKRYSLYSLGTNFFSNSAAGFRGTVSISAIHIGNSLSVGNGARIALGYVAPTGTYAPGSIDFIQGSISGSGSGQLTLGVRDVTTDTAPIGRLTLTEAGAISLASSAQANNGALGISSGAVLSIGANTITDTATLASGTVVHGAVSFIGAATIAATNASVTYTNASTLYIADAPAAGTNVTVTNAFGLYSAASNNYLNGLSVSSTTKASSYSSSAGGKVVIAGGTSVTDGAFRGSGVIFDLSLASAPNATSGIAWGYTNSGANSNAWAAIQVRGISNAGNGYGDMYFMTRSVTTDTVPTTRLKILNTGAVLATSPIGLGYGTGAGGTVTQLTSRVTGVTLNTPTGAITLFSTAGTTTATSFTVTNSTVADTDVVILSQKSGTDLYDLMVTAVGAGSFRITFRTTGGTTTETPVFNFAVIKGVSA